jgi:hypothetical protein
MGHHRRGLEAGSGGVGVGVVLQVLGRARFLQVRVLGGETPGRLAALSQFEWSNAALFLPDVAEHAMVCPPHGMYCQPTCEKPEGGRL